MTSIGIIGAGVAGLHLGLFLRQHGIQATIYTEKTPEQQFGSRLPAMVARAWHTRERERALGVNHWDCATNEFLHLHISVNGEHPIAFRGTLAHPWIAVDMRIYFGRLLEDFAARGGDVVISEVQGRNLEHISANHDLLVVATGRGGLNELFPRVAAHSPFTSPQRRLLSGFFRGITPPVTPQSASVTFVPGHGELFEYQLFSFEPQVTGLSFEATPGGAFEPLAQMHYQEDPQRFTMTIMEVLRNYAPTLYERIDPTCFGLTRPLDVLQGGVTPAVRCGYIRLSNGKYALALGDVRVINDPITGQGANTASRTAWMLGEAIREGENYDEAFCRRVDQAIWAYAGPIATWSNAMLQAPPPHIIEFMVASTQHQPIADSFVRIFEQPLQGWELLSNSKNTVAFLKQHGWQAMPKMMAA
jgi:2-polyprenyl-6-methoxyphenol hydroxylase-like FAD-dependent oxidoreductase